MCKKAPDLCQVYSAVPDCYCNAPFDRVSHPTYRLSLPECSSCGARPKTYKIRKVLKGQIFEMRTDRKGHKLKTVEDVHRTAQAINRDIEEGIFNHRNYQMRGMNLTVSDTVADFINNKFLPSRKGNNPKDITLDDKLFIQEFMAPFFEDVGSFVVCEVHLRDFISTFNLKGEDKQRATRLFNVITSEIQF